MAEAAEEDKFGFQVKKKDEPLDDTGNRDDADKEDKYWFQKFGKTKKDNIYMNDDEAKKDKIYMHDNIYMNDDEASVKSKIRKTFALLKKRKRKDIPNPVPATEISPDLDDDASTPVNEVDMYVDENPYEIPPPVPFTPQEAVDRKISLDFEQTPAEPCKAPANPDISEESDPSDIVPPTKRKGSSFKRRISSGLKMKRISRALRNESTAVDPRSVTATDIKPSLGPDGSPHADPSLEITIPVIPLILVPSTGADSVNDTTPSPTEQAPIDETPEPEEDNRRKTFGGVSNVELRPPTKTGSLKKKRSPAMWRKKGKSKEVSSPLTEGSTNLALSFAEESQGDDTLSPSLKLDESLNLDISFSHDNDDGKDE